MNLDQLKHELMCQELAIDYPKDIIIVVHNQLDYTKECIESIKRNTINYNLYIWDNGSNIETQEYLKTLNAIIHRSEYNTGFIKPNNILASIGKSPYIILLNNDTHVHAGWDKILLGFLQQSPEYWLVGGLGGILDHTGKGVGVAHGDKIDFVQGWCMCLKRETYDKYGLFDEENLSIAFCEDADLSLRLRDNGGKIYALNAELVYHYGNVTIKEISKTQNTLASFEKNHQYIRDKWKKYLNRS